MNRRDHGRPGDAYTGIVSGLWPQLGDGDPRQYDLDTAFSEVATDRTLNMETGEWEATTTIGTRALLRITCEPSLHSENKAPMLGEVWKTSRGLLFVSKLPGAVFDPDDDADHPLDPPAAVLSKRDRVMRARGQSTKGSGPGWEPVPVTVVRILLDGPVLAPLWVKCADHGPAEVDIVKLARVYKLDQGEHGGRDTQEPMVIYLHDVVALS